MENQTNPTPQIINIQQPITKSSGVNFLLKNPYILTLVIIATIVILYLVFKKGKADENVTIPEIKIDDAPTNPDLGKTPEERTAFSAKAVTYAKKVYDLTAGVDVGWWSDKATEKAKIYGEMYKLNKTQLTLVNDKWIDKWFIKNSESMYAAILDDNHWYQKSPANEKALLKLLEDYELNDN